MIIETCENPKYYNKMWRACNKCPKCKARRQREWTLRGKLEALEHKGKTIFCTFTYEDKHLKKTAIYQENKFDQGGTLIKRDPTLMFKRLRKYLGKDHEKISYILCGEYGQKTWRPHYHAIIYGLSALELSEEEWKMIWKKGNVQIKTITSINQIAYVVGYINKKITDHTSKEHYGKNNRIAPFQRQSQKLGLKWSKKRKHDWIEQFKTELNGKECAIPRYFIKKIFEEEGKKLKLENKITIADVDNEKIITEKHTSKYYKVFINPNGEMTKKILKKELEMQIQSITKFCDRKNIDSKELTQELYQNFMNRTKKIENEWNDLQNLSHKELIEKYTNYTTKIINRPQKKAESTIIPTSIPINIWKEMQQDAIDTNYKTKTKAKHRATLDINEELQSLY